MGEDIALSEHNDVDETYKSYGLERVLRQYELFRSILISIGVELIVTKERKYRDIYCGTMELWSNWTQ